MKTRVTPVNGTAAGTRTRCIAPHCEKTATCPAIADTVSACILLPTRMENPR
jgi:hypothetical protein